MKKIIVASHHKLANGFKDTLEYILPNTVEIIDISAYLENVSVDKQIDEVLSNFTKEEQIFVFTDIPGGSVNQAFIRRLNDYNIELISGTNLSILISIATQLGEKNIDKDTIREEIINAASEIVYVNDKLASQSLDEDDE
ncbi:PTS N-acetylglucosamine transporter subunit IIBC [Sneathia sp. DSM 16631]|uniref:PTS sugar transporter subunit IIA n=1 Tax=Sneathia sp. DSM 16631 TaxID=2777994 RepID=UPI001865E2BF|nr:PTS N-acetylglucosamine transporter subunit IIBC [Sneathia sp. DSM 16631]MBE3031390.1 PTS N-acetylglucosamine transporter subunit IIBC [Sneathia sp. DSM 16631]